MSAGTSQSDSESSGTWEEPVNLPGYGQSKVVFLCVKPGIICKCEVKILKTIQMVKLLLLSVDAVLKLPGIIGIGDTGTEGLFILSDSFQPCMHQVAQPESWIMRNVQYIGHKLTMSMPNLKKCSTHTHPNSQQPENIPGWLSPLVKIGCRGQCNDFRQVKALGLKRCLIFVSDGLPAWVGVCKTW